jgi:hypothetical protein
MLGGRIEKLLLGIGLLTLAGCGGGGGGGGSSTAKPPLPPWTMNIYETPDGRKLAEGTLTNKAEGQFLVRLAGKAYPLEQKDVTLSSGKAKLSLADQPEAFAAAEFQRQMSRLSQGQSAQLHSLATGRVYAFEPEK